MSVQSIGCVGSIEHRTEKNREFLRGDANEPFELSVQMVLADPELLTELANRQRAMTAADLPKSSGEPVERSRSRPQVQERDALT